jgi:transposase
MRAHPRVGRPVPTLTLTQFERETLQRWARQPTTARARAQRARVILRCAAGQTNTRAARALRLTKQTVGKWRQRFLAKRLDGLLDHPRSGAPRSIRNAKVETVVRLTLESTPRAAPHWSTRAMAARCGLSQTTVSRIWRAFGLRPPHTETSKPLPDPRFGVNVRDVVGLYLDPPERALALCVDEKTQTQARSRTGPRPHVRPGQPERRRHGRTSLFAALDVLGGTNTGHRDLRHRVVDFRRFLETIDAAVPADLEIHLVLDNDVIREAPVIRRWLAERSRYHLHATPIGSSWLHLVDRWFGQLAQKQRGGDAHHRTRVLEAAIVEDIALSDGRRKPFVWTRTADEIGAGAQRPVGESGTRETRNHAAAPRPGWPDLSPAGSQIATWPPSTKSDVPVT